MFIIKYKSIFIGISVLLVLAAIGAVAFFGLTFGIDFTGGSIIEVSYPSGRPDTVALDASLASLELGAYSLRLSGDDGYVLRSRTLAEDEHARVVSALSLEGGAPVIENRFSTIGPVIGQELRRKSWIAIALVILAIILYIAYVFRKVSKPVSSWKYGFIAIIALVHDVLVPTGAFAILGSVRGFEVDTLFITALLAILGYSVNDTIVVFDRIRENLAAHNEHHTKETFAEIVGRSLKETFVRSLNTSLTTLLVLIVLFIVGGPTVHAFVFALIAGVIAGTYSSLFLASPLLVLWATKSEG